MYFSPNLVELGFQVLFFSKKNSLVALGVVWLEVAGILGRALVLFLLLLLPLLAPVAALAALLLLDELLPELLDEATVVRVHRL